MIISTVKYLEEIREAEKRGYQKGVETMNERAWSEETERSFRECMRDIRTEISDLKREVKRLSGDVPKKQKGERPVRGSAKVMPVFIKLMQMADEKPEVDQSEAPGEAPECEAECAENEGCTASTE